MRKRVIKIAAQNSRVLVRHATEGDIELLVKIGRINFPKYLEWCTRRQAKKWWESMLGSRFVDTWVYELNGQVVAFVVLVSKPDEYRKEERRLRPGVRILLYVFAKRPWFLATKILGRILRIYRRNLNYIHPTDVRRLAGKAIWVNCIAVLPEMQNRRIGGDMIKFCEQRACELGCDSIRLRVNIANKGSIRFHERLGFMKTGKKKDEYTYMKALCETDGRQTTFLSGERG